MNRFTTVIERLWQWLLGGSQHNRRTLSASGRGADQQIARGSSPRPRTTDDPSVRTADIEPQTLAGGGRGDATASSETDQQRVIRSSRELLGTAFDAAHPVERRRELRGREEQLEAMFDGVLDQRKHAIVHGARGSGKTSLVRVFADHADRQGVVLIYLACDAQSDFGALMRPFLRFLPTTNLPAGRERAFKAQIEALGSNFGPRQLVSLLTELTPKPVIFILDEFDRVTDPAVQDQVATAMKLLSDAKAPVQLLVVGIARSVTDLIDLHPSLRRHMVAIPVRQISSEEVGRLIDDGAARAKMTVEPAVRDQLVSAAAGSPYHARLFAYHTGLRALRDGSTLMDRDHAFAGLQRATAEWAQMNDTDYVLLMSLVKDRQHHEAAIDLAKRAASDQWLSADQLKQEIGANQFDRLRPTMASDADGAQVQFKDSLVPQFLLAMLMVQRENDARERNTPAPLPSMAGHRE